MMPRFLEITFNTLYTLEGLQGIHQQFLEFLKGKDISLFEYYEALKDNYATISPLDLSEGIITLAPLLEEFLGALFGIQHEISSLFLAETSLKPLSQCKRVFVQRHVFQKYRGKVTPPLSPAPPSLFLVTPAQAGAQGIKQDLSSGCSNEAPMLYQVALGPAGLGGDKEEENKKWDELLFATQVMEWLKNPHAHEKELTQAEEYAAWALFTEKGQKHHEKGTLFKLPRKLDFLHLIDLSEKDGKLSSKNPHPRVGFNHTDSPITDKYASDQAHYCIACHAQGKDTCRTGFKDKKNPLGESLTGCPLGQKISEMNVLKSQGHTLGALAVITIDNPMVAATGRRICNACSKACIFQKQQPVDIPSIETHILEKVLALPWGFEIYSLLTRWNPLKFAQILPSFPTGKKVLVAGMGPAGFALAHHMLNDGHTVVGIEGLSMNPLPPSLQNRNLIHNIMDFFEPLDTRTPTGFGGVAEYGITVRWNKNFLLVIRLLLERCSGFVLFGSTRLESNITTEQAIALGFDHIALCLGAGKPNIPSIQNNFVKGVYQASDFLMSLQLKKTPPPIRTPIVVIGSGLTAVDAATESLACCVEGEATLVYRRSIQESPAYIKNHEELASALEEGVAYLENKSPQRIEVDDQGYAERLHFTDGTHIPAKTILLATGTNPNTMIAEENPTFFQTEGEFLNPLSLNPFWASRIDKHRFISFLGDLNPQYSGSVVHALASAKNAAPLITEALSHHAPASSLSTEDFFAHLKTQITSRVVKKEDNAFVVCSPLSSQNLKPGQFFRLEHGGRTLPLMGVPGGDDTIIFNRSLSLNEGDVLSLMGPTGSPMMIPENKTVLLLGDSAPLSFMGSAMEDKGCKVFYNAPLSKEFDEILVLGSVRGMEEILSKRAALKENVRISGILPSPMQCMMKGICAKCIQRHVPAPLFNDCVVEHRDRPRSCSSTTLLGLTTRSPSTHLKMETGMDQETGQEHFVFSCQKQIHLLDDVDFEMLKNRMGKK